MEQKPRKRMIRWNPAKLLSACLIGGILLTTGKGFSHLEDPSEYSFINPLIRYVRFKELNSFRPQVEQLLTELKKKDPSITDIIVYFRSLTDGIWFGIGEKEQIWPGSLMKIPVMMAYYKLAETDPGILDRKILIPEESGLIQSPLKKGRTYSVDQLIGYMIRQSDNVSVKLLAREQSKALAQTYFDLGLRHSYDSHTPAFTIKDVARFFRILYNGSYLNPELSERALKLLSETEFMDGLLGGVPSKIPCSHKFGIQIVGDFESMELHDCGIVYYPENPYLLGVSVKVTVRKDRVRKGRQATVREEDAAAEVIRAVSQLVYTEVHKQYSSAKNSYEFEN